MQGPGAAKMSAEALQKIKDDAQKVRSCLLYKLFTYALLGEFDRGCFRECLGVLLSYKQVASALLSYINTDAPALFVFLYRPIYPMQLTNELAVFDRAIETLTNL